MLQKYIDQRDESLFRSIVSYEDITTADGSDDGSTTLICSRLTTKPDFDGGTVVIASGDYKGQSSSINGITTGGTVTPITPFDGQITANTKFKITTVRPTAAEVSALQTVANAIKALVDILDLTSFRQEKVGPTDCDHTDGRTWVNILDRSSISYPTKICGFKATIAGGWAGKAQIAIIDGTHHHIFPFQDYYEQDTDFTSGVQVVFNFPVVVPIADGYIFQFRSSNAADGAGKTLELNNLDVIEVG